MDAHHDGRHGPVVKSTNLGLMMAIGRHGHSHPSAPLFGLCLVHLLYKRVFG